MHVPIDLLAPSGPAPRRPDVAGTAADAGFAGSLDRARAGSGGRHDGGRPTDGSPTAPARARGRDRAPAGPRDAAASTTDATGTAAPAADAPGEPTTLPGGTGGGLDTAAPVGPGTVVADEQGQTASVVDAALVVPPDATRSTTDGHAASETAAGRSVTASDARGSSTPPVSDGSAHVTAAPADRSPPAGAALDRPTGRAGAAATDGRGGADATSPIAPSTVVAEVAPVPTHGTGVTTTGPGATTEAGPVAPTFLGERPTVGSAGGSAATVDAAPEAGGDEPVVGDGVPEAGDAVPEAGDAVPEAGDGAPEVGEGVPVVGGRDGARRAPAADPADGSGAGTVVGTDRSSGGLPTAATTAGAGAAPAAAATAVVGGHRHEPLRDGAGLGEADVLVGRAPSGPTSADAPSGSAPVAPSAPSTGASVLARIEAVAAALRTAPPPREAVIDVDGVRITVRVVGDTVHVQTTATLDHAQTRDLSTALAGRGLSLADPGAEERPTDDRRARDGGRTGPERPGSDALGRPAEAGGGAREDTRVLRI